MKRLAILVVLICFSTIALFAQQSKRPNYKLLWKISGKGLTSPSYLFGTMHVYDNRAFDFSDSVLLKISACKAFALEFHPDSATSVLINKILKGSKGSKNKFEELLSKEEYKTMDSMMRKKTGYTLEKLRSPRVAEMFLERKSLKRDKAAFVDAYLYNIAHRQGKTILGLEDIEQQFSALDDESSDVVKRKLNYYLRDADSAVVNTGYAEMLDLYHQGDIDKLRVYMRNSYRSNMSSYDKLITNRNLGMADNIVKAVHQHSTFFAVGAGHLPGEEGLINLLRQRGYTVTLVQPKFTGLAKKYKYEPEPDRWFKYTSEEGAYAIDMPSKPAPLKVDSLGLTFQIGFDLGTSMVYQSTFIMMTNKYTGRPKDALDDIEKNYRKNQRGKIDKGVDVTIDGSPGREYIMTFGENVFKVRIIIRGNTAYMLMVGPTREAAVSADAQNFMKSFRMLPFDKKEWKDFTDKTGAFRVNMIGEVNTRDIDTEVPDATDQMYHIKIFYSSNPLREESYIIRYNNFPIGYVSNDDSAYCVGLIHASYAQMQGSSLVVNDTEVNAFKGYEYSFDMGTKGFVKGQALLRGNRFYLTMTTSTKGTDGSGINEFLNSVKFIDYETTAFKEYLLRDKGIKVKFPSAYQVDTTEQNAWHGDKDRIIYNALDDNTGVAYILVVDKLSDYEQYDDREHFFEKTNDGYKSDGDSIIQKTDFTYKGFMAQDVTIQRKKSNAIKKVRTILNGHNLYEMIAFLPADYLQSKTPQDEFFNSLQVAEVDKWNLFSDKTDLILKDISSLDTLAQEASSMALGSHDFKVSDLPKLYKALSCSYPDDSVIYGGVKLKLLRKLKETNDASTIKFITDFYATLPDSSALKDHALSVLSEMKSEVATQQLLAILKNDKHDDFSSYVILNPYYDSLALSSAIASNVTMLESKFASPSYLFNLIQAALDSGEFTADVKKGVIESLIKLGLEKTAQPIKLNKTDDDYYKRSDYFQGLAEVLSTIPFNNDVKKILSGIHQCGDASVMLITSKTLFVNNVEVSINDLEVIAADPLYRLKLYEMLKEVSKEKLFPAKFLTQQKLSESALTEYFDYEDGVPENIAFLEKRIVKYNNEKMYVYCYKYKYEGDEEWYVALSGPYPLKSTEIVLRGDFTFSTYEVYGKDKIDNIINAALKEYGAELN